LVGRSQWNFVLPPALGQSGLALFKGEASVDAAVTAAGLYLQCVYRNTLFSAPVYSNYGARSPPDFIGDR
jgi:hypothetical protein